jgi:hypothetical protein
LMYFSHLSSLTKLQICLGTITELIFFHEGHTYIRPISPFKFVSCHRLSDEITYKLLHPSNTFCLDAAVPGLTSTCIFDNIHERCVHILVQNCELFDPLQYVAPAAFVQTFLNSAVGVRLPSHQDWVDAYTSDPVMSKIIQFIQNPGLLTNKLLEESKLNANYCPALRQSLISIKNGILIYREVIVGSKSYTWLQLVSLKFCNILFVAFHANPIGAHHPNSGRYSDTLGLGNYGVWYPAGRVATQNKNGFCPT